MAGKTGQHQSLDRVLPEVVHIASLDHVQG